MSSIYQSRRFDQRTSSDADQTEFAAILRETTALDSGIFDDRIAGALDDFAPLDTRADEGWHRQDLELDLAVGRVQEEIERRQKLLGTHYPFELDDSKLIYKKSKTHVYEFCLATSCADTITSGEFVKLPRTFERLTAVLVCSYLGADSESLHTGWPRDRSAKFKPTMRLLSKRSGEWLWSPQPDLPDEPTGDKDNGVDFVTWKTSPDGRPGQLFILAQCACGDDWEGKFRDLTLERMGKWFNPMTYVPGIRAFITPFLLSDGHLLNVQREAGLAFDRARLTVVAEKSLQKNEVKKWLPQLRDLAALVIKQPGG